MDYIGCSNLFSNMYENFGDFSWVKKLNHMLNIRLDLFII